MADKTIDELQTVAVGDLPLAPDIYDDTLIPVEQQGDAKHITGRQFKGYALSASQAFADSVKNYATNAQTSADRAEAARDSIVVDEAKLSQAVSSASASETSAKVSEDNAAASEIAAIDAANRAQAEADRATIPAVSGVYNVILTDSVTGGRYALIVENGRLAILGVSDTLDATNMNFIDTATGAAYELTVESGRLNLKEV